MNDPLAVQEFLRGSNSHSYNNRESFKTGQDNNMMMRPQLPPQFQDPIVTIPPRSLQQLQQERGNILMEQQPDTFEQFIQMCELHVGFWHLQRDLEPKPIPSLDTDWVVYIPTFLVKLRKVQRHPGTRCTGFDVEFMHILDPVKRVKFLYYVDIENRVAWMCSLAHDIDTYHIKPPDQFIEYIEFVSR